LVRQLVRRAFAGGAVLVVATVGAMVSVLGASGARASDNGLSIRPAMGWSSWSFVRRTPTAAKIRAQAAAMKSSGLAGHGFVYVNLDDFYQKCDANGFVVDSYGRWVVDETTFPGGIKPVADYVHSLGLKFGFYVQRHPAARRDKVDPGAPGRRRIDDL